MTTTGEQGREPVGRPRRPVPRTLAILGLLATAVAGGTWAEVRLAGRMHTDHQTSVDGVSQDSAGQRNAVTVTGVGAAGGTPLDAVLPPTVDFPSTLTSPEGYRGTRATVAAGKTDCVAVFSVSAPAALTTGCSGYLTTDYVRQDDHAVYSSVTVLYYPDAATAARVAGVLNAPNATTAIGYLRFQQPGGSLPATLTQAGTTASSATGGGSGAPSTSATPGGSASPSASPSISATPSASAKPVPKSPDDPTEGATAGRVAAVGRAVTIVQTAYADGSALDPELETPTWYLSYTVNSALAWEPDQHAGGTVSTTP